MVVEEEFAMLGELNRRCAIIRRLSWERGAPRPCSRTVEWGENIQDSQDSQNSQNSQNSPETAKASEATGSPTLPRRCQVVSTTDSPLSVDTFCRPDQWPSAVGVSDSPLLYQGCSLACVGFPRWRTDAHSRHRCTDGACRFRHGYFGHHRFIIANLLRGHQRHCVYEDHVLIIGPPNIHHIAMSELNISFQRYLGTSSIPLPSLRKRPPDPRSYASES